MRNMQEAKKLSMEREREKEKKSKFGEKQTKHSQNIKKYNFVDTNIFKSIQTIYIMYMHPPKCYLCLWLPEEKISKGKKLIWGGRGKGAGGVCEE